MKNYTVSDILNSIKGAYEIKGKADGKYFTNTKPIQEANEESLVWVKANMRDKEKIIPETKARILICDKSIKIEDDWTQYKCFIMVENPKLVFLRIVSNLLVEKIEFGIHSTAFIHPEAKLAKGVYIGPFVYIGRCEIGENTIIHGHCHLYDGITIGKNVTIHSGTVIGADGFGYERNEAGELEKFPHLGGVIIEDNVEIGANTCIDRGSLGNTHLKTGAKIDNLVHIAHNVVVGKHSIVIALAMIGGSTKIGDYSWVSPSAALLNGLVLGDKTTIGMGAVLTKDVPDGETWAGSPAKPLDQFIQIQSKLKKL